MANNPTIIDVDLMELQPAEILPIGNTGPEEDPKIIAYLTYTFGGEWRWDELSNTYTWDRVLTIHAQQLRNRSLPDNDIARYKKIIQKKNL